MNLRHIQQAAHSAMYSAWLKLPHGRLLVCLTAILVFIWQSHTTEQLTGIANYIPLHTTLKMVAIIIAFLSFAVVWSVERRNTDGRLLLLGSLFVGVGLLDFMHMISYKGMPDFVTPSSRKRRFT
ncbi:MAG: hypothetical protein D3908_16750, partial [Candidatus Electrothrix sp. AUS4]|nr:hypothetical protein [Candidatus Electrothrix sp. AUS4]